MKLILSILSAGAFLFALSSLPPAKAAVPEPPDPLHIIGTVLTPAGKPAPDATIVFYLVDNDAHTVWSEQTLHPTAAGTFDIPWDWKAKARTYPVLYVFSPEGVAVVGLTHGKITVTLAPPTSVPIRLVDGAGKPLAHLRVCPEGFSRDRQYGRWSDAVTDRLSAETDENGVATLTGMPQGWSLLVSVGDPSYIVLEADRFVHLAEAPTTPEATVHLARGGSLSGTIVYGPTRQPAAKVLVAATSVSEGRNRGWARTDAQGRYHMSRLPAGTYMVSVDASQDAATQEWTAAQHSAAVSVGAATGNVDFMLIHGAVLTGIVTDLHTGKPLPRVFLFVQSPAGSQNIQTGDDGRYTLHVPPGSGQVMLQAAPGMTETRDQDVEVTDGETKTVNFQSTPPVLPVVVAGVVIGPDGKPVPGARVTARGESQQEQDAQQTTDAQGKFTFDDPKIMADMRLYATAGRLFTPVGVRETEGKTVVLRLASGIRTLVQGRVQDADGKAVPGATVMLYRQYGPNAGGVGVGTTRTDAGGRYMFTPAVSDATYSAGVQAKGFGYQFTNQAAVAPNKPLNLAAVTLPRTDSFVGGTVVDMDGKPIENADVSFINAGDGHALTGKQGRFHLAGATRGKAIVEVRAAGDRLASIQVTSGRDDTIITAASQSEREAEGKRFSALLEADPTNHGDGANAHALLRAACAQAAQGGRRVLLVFHASWCGPCFLLHRFLEDPRVKPVLDAHFVVQDIDIWENGTKKAWENPGGTALYARYGGERAPGKMQGVPFFAVLDASGKKLGDARMHGDNIGFPSDTQSREFFLKTLQSAAPRLTADERATLQAGLARSAKI